MGIARRWLIRGTAVLGITATALTGCQTYPAGFGGMTLPSPRYLKHYPQYFPPDPPFPLQRELDSMQNAEGLAPAPGAGAAGTGLSPLPAPGIVPLPNPVPAAPGGAPPGGAPAVPGGVPPGGAGR